MTDVTLLLANPASLLDILVNLRKTAQTRKTYRYYLTLDSWGELGIIPTKFHWEGQAENRVLLAKVECRQKSSDRLTVFDDDLWLWRFFEDELRECAEQAGMRLAVVAPPSEG